MKCSQLAVETGDLVYLDQGGFAWPISYDETDSFVLWYEPCSVLFYYITDHYIEDSWNHYWAICPECGKLGIATTITSSSLFRNDIVSCECCTQRYPHSWLDRNSEIVMKAYDKALKYWS